jgi:hypothetical protein
MSEQGRPREELLCGINFLKICGEKIRRMNEFREVEIVKKDIFKMARSV